MQVNNILCEYLKNPLGIGIKSPRITWNVDGLIKQSAYEIIYYVNDVKKTSSIIESDSMFYVFKEEFQNQGIGSKILDSIKKVFNKKAITINCLINEDELFLKRKKFYKKNGFVDTNYILSDKNNKYNVYSTNRVLSFGKYKEFLNKLSLGIFKVDLIKKTSLENKE